MTFMRACLLCIAMLAALSACASHRDAPADKPHCAKPSQGGEDETDGGVGGTGKTPEECEKDLRSE